MGFTLKTIPHTSLTFRLYRRSRCLEEHKGAQDLSCVTPCFVEYAPADMVGEREDSSIFLWSKQRDMKFS